jgi:hypothetical protein
MQFEEYANSLNSNYPPENINQFAQAMWYDAKGDWEKAHNIVQDIENKTAYRIHAYLHRKEGDSGNAGYWYNKASTKLPDYSLEKEWEEIVKAVL